MKCVESDFYVPTDHPCLPGHFPAHPIVPGVLLLDHVLTIAQGLTGRRVARLHHVKFTSTLLPQERARVRCEMGDGCVVFRVTVQRGSVAVDLAKGRLLLDANGFPG